MHRNRRPRVFRSVSLATKAAAAIIFFLALLPASAQVYENGPVNGWTNAWAISDGYVVANSFHLSEGIHTIVGFEFYVWVSIDSIPQTVDWAILSSDSGHPVVNGQGTTRLQDTFLFYNWYGAVRKEVSSWLDVKLNEKEGVYWLVLRNATTTKPGEYVFWDENSGLGCHSEGCPSNGWSSYWGATIPSEAFVIHGCSGCVCSAPVKLKEPCKPESTESK